MASLVAAVAFMTTTLFAAEPNLQAAQAQIQSQSQTKVQAQTKAQHPPRRLPTDLRLCEWRVLQAAPGKLDALHSRLRDH
jgi:hypothetical protein